MPLKKLEKYDAAEYTCHSKEFEVFTNCDEFM